MFDVLLRKILWVYCAGVKGNDNTHADSDDVLKISAAKRFILEVTHPAVFLVKSKVIMQTVPTF